jgi:hypothetical protein
VLLRVVERPSGPPTSDDQRETVWSANYGDGAIEDAEGLSGSILTTTLPEFEVGTWYSVDRFKEKVNRAVTAEAASWTTLDIMSKDIAGPGYVEIQVQHDVAALMICRAVIDHLELTGRYSGIWIRVE